MRSGSATSSTGSTTRRDGEARWYRAGSTLAGGLRDVVEAAGLPEISLHSLRRTYERLMMRAGVEDGTRRALAGWRTPAVQQAYGDVDRVARARASGALVELVRGSAAGVTPAAEKGVGDHGLPAGKQDRP